MEIPEHIKKATLRELGRMYKDAQVFGDSEARKLIIEELKTRSKNPGVVGFPCNNKIYPRAPGAEKE